MATLKEHSTDRTVSLPARVLVGRDPSCDLVVDGPRVSREHARIHWQLSGWTVRDLGSRNGTWLNGTRLEPGEDAALGVEDRLRFGDAGPEWVLVDRAAPPISAVNLSSRKRLLGESRRLDLPDGARIEARPQGRYVLALGPVEVDAFDGQTVTIGGVPWRLELPGSAEATVGDPSGMDLGEIGLSFTVSRDEERVSVTLRHRGRSHPVPERAYHYVLLVLARARLEDGAAGHPPGECGWRDRQDLYRDLAMDRESFNKAVSRLRKQFEGLGVTDARHLVESWGESRRIGVDDLVVE